MKQNQKGKFKKNSKKNFFFIKIFEKKKIKKIFFRNPKKVKYIMRGNTVKIFKKIQNWKNRKIKIFEYFCAFCVYTQKFLGDNSLMLCCFPKIFSWFFDTFWVSKKFVKKIFFRKKGHTAQISEKKNKKKIEKSKNLADRPKSAKYFLGIKTYVLSGYSVWISFNSYNNWVLQSLV